MYVDLNKLTVYFLASLKKAFCFVIQLLKYNKYPENEIKWIIRICVRFSVSACDESSAKIFKILDVLWYFISPILMAFKI